MDQTEPDKRSPSTNPPLRAIRRLIDHQRTSLTECETLFHYTSAEGMLGILRSKRIHATNVRYLNDRSERKFGEDQTTRLSRECWPGTKCDPCFLEKAIELLAFLNVRNETYVSCFSSKVDLLGQWRSYGCDGHGFAIGFDTRKMFRLADWARKLDLAPVVYDEQQQKEIVKDVCEATAATIASGGDPDDAVYELTYSLNWLCGLFKHDSFSIEHEWRLIQILPSNQPSPSLHFKAKRTTLVPYIEIDLHIGAGNGAISSVMVGPSAESDLAELSTKMFLLANGYGNIRVERSDLPMRRPL